MLTQTKSGPARALSGFWVALSCVFGLLFFFNVPIPASLADEGPAAEEADEPDADEDDGGKAKDGMSETFAADPAAATLYVAREKKFKGSAVKKKVYLNSAFAAKLGNGRYAVFHLEPGEYLVGVLEDSGKRSLTLNMEAGKIYYAQLFIKMGIAKARGQVEALSEKVGQDLIRTLNTVKDSDYVE